jgi:hypothetical protein
MLSLQADHLSFVVSDTVSIIAATALAAVILILRFWRKR